MGASPEEGDSKVGVGLVGEGAVVSDVELEVEVPRAGFREPMNIIIECSCTREVSKFKSIP